MAIVCSPRQLVMGPLGEEEADQGSTRTNKVKLCS